MLKPGNIVYNNSTQGTLDPVTIVDTQDMVRQSPTGEDYVDTMVSVKSPDGTIYQNFSYHFQYVPFIPEIELNLQLSALK